MIRIISAQQPEEYKDLAPLFTSLFDKNPSLRSLISHYIGAATVDMLLTDGADDFNKEQIQNRLLRIARDLLLTKDQLDQGHVLFQEKYNTGIVPAQFRDVKLHWKELADDINSATNPISTAYNFIHRYNGQNWFLTANRMELLRYGLIGHSTALKEGYSLFDITYSGYKTKTDLSATDPEGNWYDQTYIDQVKLFYNSNLVNSIILPAQELKLLLHHNLNTGYNEQDYNINFKSVTYEVEDPQNPLATYFPHCVAVYASTLNGPCLDNGSVVAGASFNRKGANFDSLCPPSCKMYFWPNELPV